MIWTKNNIIQYMALSEEKEETVQNASKHAVGNLVI